MTDISAIGPKELRVQFSGLEIVSLCMSDWLFNSFKCASLQSVQYFPQCPYLLLVQAHQLKQGKQQQLSSIKWQMNYSVIL